MTSAKPLRIAISGGGVAGATLMHACMQHPSLDAHIFEAAPAFREAGLAIGIARQAQEALELIGPSAIGALHRSGAVPSSGTYFLVGTGPEAGAELDKIDVSKMDRVESITQRADFLRELLAVVPGERMHASKQLSEVTQPDGVDGEIELKFSDGTMHACDVLIGADGIRSFVRGYILGADDPAVIPHSAGWYCLWMMRPYEQARKLLGEDLVNKDDHREIAWLSDGTAIMHNISDGAKQAQFVACVWDPESVGGQDWMKPADVEVERKVFEHWPQKFRNALGQFLGEEQEPKRIYLWEHPHAKTYVKGNVAVMGDAAHAMTPWQGSGGGTSIEDALVLSTLLLHSKSRADAAVALQVYDEVRRPRTQSIVESSKAIGRLTMGKDPELGRISVANMKGQLAHRWDHILYFDNAKAADEAVKMMEEGLRTQAAVR